jgi:hypothetical protein
MSETKNLYQRIADVQAEIGYVKKDGTNMGVGYKYVSEAALVGALKEHLIAAGLTLIFKSGKPYVVHQWERIKRDKQGVEYQRTPVFLTAVDCEMTIVNIDNPAESVVITGSGYGEDAGDKGVYKAITGANKYMLFKLFQVPTGDDPEKDKSKGKGKSSPHGYNPEEEESEEGEGSPNSEEQEEAFENFRKQIADAKLQEELDSIGAVIKKSADGGHINEAHRTELKSLFKARKAIITSKGEYPINTRLECKAKTTSN